MDDDHDTIPPSPKRARPDMDMGPVPQLPPKSALRSSRLLDNHGLALGGSVEAVRAGATTPLDAYLSSEEDASSDADDFSDYGYESSNDDVESPTPRSSHEDTARLVSVVFSGQPSIVDLSIRRRSMSPVGSAQIKSRKRTSTISTMTSHSDSPPSPVSSASSSPAQTSRKSSLLSDLVSKKRPLFLNIDPYANGSTYSLDIPAGEDLSSAARTPRTSNQLLRGVSRTLSLVRKKSRPMLKTLTTSHSQAATTPPPSRQSFHLRLSVENLAPHPSAGAAAPPEPAQGGEAQVGSVITPQTPITYNDIVRAAKKNSMLMPPSPSPPSPPMHLPPSVESPTSPSLPAYSKRGILSGLAARRRSIKLTGKTPAVM